MRCKSEENWKGLNKALDNFRYDAVAEGQDKKLCLYDVLVYHMSGLNDTPSYILDVGFE